MSNEMIELRTLLGGRKIFPRSALKFRPSVYGIIVHDGALLVTIDTRTGRYSLPGGGIDPGEHIEDALVREIREEAGLDVEVGEFFDRGESFFYCDPVDEAWHSLLFFFRCTVHGVDLAGTDDTERAEWMPLSMLRGADFFEIYTPIIHRIIQEHNIES